MVLHEIRNCADVKNWEIRDCEEVRNSVEARIHVEVRGNAKV